jgi:manganese/zinc/iron transport system permease protein
LLVTLFHRNSHIGLEAIMGNVEALHIDDLKMTGSLFLGNFFLLLLFFKEFRLTAFDASFAKLTGGRPSLFHYLLMVQLAATAIGAFRAIGVLLFLAFLVGPPLTARLFTNHLGKWLLLSSFFGAAYVFIGVALSRHMLSVYEFSVSTSALVVVLTGVGYLAALFLAPKKGFLAQRIAHSKLKKALLIQET